MAYLVMQDGQRLEEVTESIRNMILDIAIERCVEPREYASIEAEVAARLGIEVDPVNRQFYRVVNEVSYTMTRLRMSGATLNEILTDG
jgi:hypothetical protein